jgi:hypothetical protein
VLFSVSGGVFIVLPNTNPIPATPVLLNSNSITRPSSQLSNLVL